MRHLTLQEVNEQYGGKLPPDAVLRADHDESPPVPSKPPARRRGRCERFATLNAFVDFGMGALPGAEVKTWMILFRGTKDTGTARTVQADMARRAGINVRSVRRALEALEAKGFLRVVRRGQLNAGPSVYRVHPTGAA